MITRCIGPRSSFIRRTHPAATITSSVSRAGHRHRGSAPTRSGGGRSGDVIQSRFAFWVLASLGLSWTAPVRVMTEITMHMSSTWVALNLMDSALPAGTGHGMRHVSDSFPARVQRTPRPPRAPKTMPMTRSRFLRKGLMYVITWLLLFIRLAYERPRRTFWNVSRLNVEMSMSTGGKMKRRIGSKELSSMVARFDVANRQIALTRGAFPLLPGFPRNGRDGCAGLALYVPRRGNVPVESRPRGTRCTCKPQLLWLCPPTPLPLHCCPVSVDCRECPTSWLVSATSATRQQQVVGLTASAHACEHPQAATVKPLGAPTADMAAPLPSQGMDGGYREATEVA